jgi:diguanylate cyclase (GGDEF)-like protein
MSEFVSPAADEPRYGDDMGPWPPTGSRARLTLAIALVAAAAVLSAGTLYDLVASLAAGRPVTHWPVAGLALAGVGAVAGALVLWGMRRSPDALRAAEPGPPNGGAPAGASSPPARRDVPQPEEIESIMDSFSRMLNTIEQQAVELERYAARLDSAYKEIETSNAQLKEFSFKDEVTGLYNRRLFSIRLEEEVSRYRRFNHPVSVVLLDLDGFKEINDELGHPAGDETLRGMAEILLKHSRGINVICRYGGDEFAILLVETSKGGARLYADRIRYVLPNHRFAHGRRVSASFGIASLPEDVAPSPDGLIRAADEALYAAKRAGKNRVSVYEDIRPPLTGGSGGPGPR